MVNEIKDLLEIILIILSIILTAIEILDKLIDDDK